MLDRGYAKETADMLVGIIVRGHFVDLFRNSAKKKKNMRTRTVLFADSSNCQRVSI